MRVPHRILKRPNALGDMEFICQFQFWLWFECQVFDAHSLTWCPAIYVSEDGAAEYLRNDKRVAQYSVVTEGRNFHFGTVGMGIAAVVLSVLIWWANNG